MSVDRSPRIGILHYSAPPVVGGVENVIRAHARLFAEAGFVTSIVAGVAEQDALPTGVELIRIPELSSADPRILALSRELEQGRVPQGFEAMVEQLTDLLRPRLANMDTVIVHNVFTKHFNLPLTVALGHLLDAGAIHQCIAWCHDFSWTSPRSRTKVFHGYPWDCLRTQRSDIAYVSISRGRQQELAGLLGCPAESIAVVYSGVDLQELLALSDAGMALVERLQLMESDLNLLLPVRITEAKNIEFAAHVAASLKQGGIRARLVVTGPPDPHSPTSMKYFESLLDLRERLRVTQELRFVYASGSTPHQPLLVEASAIAELLRISDGVFMPSHSEGFGMPILEAGLLGIPIFCSDAIPAATELARKDIVVFPRGTEPDTVAKLMLDRLGASGTVRWRHRVQSEFTWNRVFRREILPLLGESAR